MSFEIIHKPTFTNQLLAVPKERVVQILEKVERLREDPSPHGTLKKKLHGYSATFTVSARAITGCSTPMETAG